MMKNIFFLLAWGCSCILPSMAQENPSAITCIIRGEVIDRPESKQLMLNREGEDFRVKTTYIPIEDGKFEYVLNCEFEEAYSLVFSDEVKNGMWMPVRFFAENDTLHFQLYPADRYKENVITGGTHTQEYLAFENRRREFAQSSRPSLLFEEWDKLYESDLVHNEQAKRLLEINRTSTDKEEKEKAIREFYKLQDSGEHYSEAAKALQEKTDQSNALAREWQLEEVKKRISIPSYYILLQLAEQPLSHFRKEEIYPPAVELYSQVYANRYPDHPYTARFQTLILSKSDIQVGGKYIDFIAPDFEGNPVTLSAQIEGKVALIDLWASWCGPCRRTSKSMIPVYEKYRNKGFMIVGVAREEKAEHGISAAQADGYPWLNLLEIKDSANIWNLYGIGNAGGSVFLVDRDGTILAINPDAEEVEKILREKLE